MYHKMCLEQHVTSFFSRDELISSVCFPQERSASCPAGTSAMMWSFCRVTWRSAALWDITGWTLPKSRFVFSVSVQPLSLLAGNVAPGRWSWEWLNVWGDTGRTADIGLCLMIHQCRSSVSRLGTFGSDRGIVYEEFTSKMRFIALKINMV